MFLIDLGPNIICIKRAHIHNNSTMSNQYGMVPKTLKEENKNKLIKESKTIDRILLLVYL